MKYDFINEAVFWERPNRFIARIELDGRLYNCHVKNTGRCRELLIPGARVLVQKVFSPARKTAYDLIAVWKDGQLFNIDSSAPNAVIGEWLKSGGLGFVPELIKPEYRHGDSRFDFYFEREGTSSLLEVKGVTLLEDGNALFPDAPTERGIKHLHGLSQGLQQGYEAYVVFLIQTRPANCLMPNRRAHPAFADALESAADRGVHVLALDSLVTEDSIIAGKALPVIL